MTPLPFTADDLDELRSPVYPYELRVGDIIADRNHLSRSGVGVLVKIEREGYALRLDIETADPDGDITDDVLVHSTDTVRRIDGMRGSYLRGSWHVNTRIRGNLRSASAPELWSAFIDALPPCHALSLVRSASSYDDEGADVFVRQYDETEQAWP